MSPVHITPGGSNFRLIDKKVLETFKQFREHDRFIRGLIGDIGYTQTFVRFVAPKRYAGSSKFSMRKMLHFALDGIMAYSKILTGFLLHRHIKRDFKFTADPACRLQ